ncbi:formate/nitrite transporter family protein [Actinoallomurus rhizosphaericola]|uniref:formate/nitrite transporter family protein n=1 Tax=Actinoallomurus rhizosphaericola TaxID=2952536 RepID=UPI0020939744|nr:formate/nitrite transporter family protein [Actinoallomurus rhizosphaericola]MCO5995529.1 formate/nitrite transporter family protein [Actinoallomurus rhizosphaericola]
MGEPSRPGEDDRPEESSRPVALEETFTRVVDEGRRRLSRPWLPLVATGLVGGVDIVTGVLALLLVEDAMTGSPGKELVAGLAFAVGFVALTMAGSELFTEDFLIPVMTVVARQATYRELIRLWSVTLAANLAAGWILTYIVDIGFPRLHPTAVEAGARYIDLGITWRALALAVLAGAVMTLMTWMQHSTTSPGVKLAPAVTTGFLLGGGGLNHAVVSSLLIFAGLQAGHAPYGYADWAGAAALAAAGNMVGGILLVTTLRLAQVPRKLADHRADSAADHTVRPEEPDA